jgi:hypothetical protein
MGTSELDHEIFDYAVEVQTVIKAALGQRNKVRSGDGHVLEKYLGLEGAHGCVESRNRVCHRVSPLKAHSLRGFNTISCAQPQPSRVEISDIGFSPIRPVLPTEIPGGRQLMPRVHLCDLWVFRRIDC